MNKTIVFAFLYLVTLGSIIFFCSAKITPYGIKDQETTVTELTDEDGNVVTPNVTHWIIPTWQEVYKWLAIDDTDKRAYSFNKDDFFVCGDFSVQLIERAKNNHWHFLFTILEWDYESENPNGECYHRGLHKHAFCSVFTTEGIVYIEPQTDELFIIEHYDTDKETLVDDFCEFEDFTWFDSRGFWLDSWIFVQYYIRMADYHDVYA